MPALGAPGLTTKVRAGIHFGNRGGNWSTSVDYLAKLRGTSSAQKYPRLAVALSSQLLSIQRTALRCDNFTIGFPTNRKLYDYLADLVKNRGGILVVRVYPSPGNFRDAMNPGPDHRLYTTGSTTPSNLDYCSGRDATFRSVYDVSLEIAKVALFLRNNGWPMQSVYFEAANEPNVEWYGKPTLNVQHDNVIAWQDMDAYFSSIYDQVKTSAIGLGLDVNVQILTPPMAQNAHAEVLTYGGCGATSLVGGSPNYNSGYQVMTNVFLTKNDGWSWHSYWRQGKEYWQSDFCNPASSDHESQYFSAEMKTAILNSNKISVITEADLIAPCFAPQSTITDKDSQQDSAQQSIWSYINQEKYAQYIASWNLTVQWADAYGGTCPPDNPPGYQSNWEQAWHEAYRDTGGPLERAWFVNWWARTEFP